MKKYLILSLVLMGVISLIGCKMNKENEEQQNEYTGTVLEVRDGEFEMAFLNGTVYDHLIVISDEKVKEGDNVVVKTNGVVMMSEPARVNATDIEILENEIEDYVLREFKITDILDDEYLMVETYVDAAEAKTEKEVYKVNYAEAEIAVAEGLKVGDIINIRYDGKMTRSYPPIVNADFIEWCYLD